MQRSTKETVRKEAQKKADQWEALAKEKAKAKQAHKVIAEIYKAAHKTDLPSANAKTFFEGWLARRKNEVKPATFSAYEHTLTVFGKFLGTRSSSPLTEIGRLDIEAFRDAQLQRIGSTTVNLYIKHLRICFEDALRDNLISENPAKGVRPLKGEEDAASRRPFTVDELKLVLAHADPEWKSMVLFGLYTGQRLGDVARITWQNIDLNAGEIRLVRAKTKGRSVIPICGPLLRQIERLEPCTDPRAPIHPKAFEAASKQRRVSGLSVQFGDFLARLGLTHRDGDLKKRSHQAKGQGRSARRTTSELSFHSLRHTATSLMKNAGISPAVVQDIIGHESAEMSTHYTHIEMDAKRKALEAMPDLVGTTQSK